MRIATWNVNSIKAREERLLRWLDKYQPDVLCLQELKVEEKAFPLEAVRERGYFAAITGQRSYNGVAILARSAPVDVHIGLDDGVDDPQARLIAATVEGLRVISAYVPNGSETSSDKFAYKKAWLERLHAYLAREVAREASLVVCGDYNIAPSDLDVARPDEWRDSVLCHGDVRAQFAQLLELGLTDSMRKCNPEAAVYSWWDYRMLGFPKGNGLRIDHILVTPAVMERATGAFIDREERKGKLPSDHAPVVLDLK